MRRTGDEAEHSGGGYSDGAARPMAGTRALSLMNGNGSDDRIPVLLFVLSLLLTPAGGWVAYRKLRPNWRLGTKPTAPIARERLEWCVKTRRDGGEWVLGRDRVTYTRMCEGGPVIASYRPTFRWMFA